MVAVPIGISCMGCVHHGKSNCSARLSGSWTIPDLLWWLPRPNISSEVGAAAPYATRPGDGRNWQASPRDMGSLRLAAVLGHQGLVLQWCCAQVLSRRHASKVELDRPRKSHIVCIVVFDSQNCSPHFLDVSWVGPTSQALGFNDAMPRDLATETDTFP